MKEKYPDAVSVYLPRGTKAQIQQLADAKGVSASTFLRMELLSTLRQHKRGHPLRQVEINDEAVARETA